MCGAFLFRIQGFEAEQKRWHFSDHSKKNTTQSVTDFQIKNGLRESVLMKN